MAAFTGLEQRNRDYCQTSSPHTKPPSDRDESHVLVGRSGRNAANQQAAANAQH